MPPSLPDFLQPLKRARGSLRRSSGPLEGNIGALYQEYWTCCSIPGWLESARGVWVDYQLTWYERRADRWTN